MMTRDAKMKKADADWRTNMNFWMEQVNLRKVNKAIKRKSSNNLKRLRKANQQLMMMLQVINNIIPLRMAGLSVYRVKAIELEGAQ